MPERLAKAKNFENTVEKIKDVVACRVTLDANGEIEEVHVLAYSKRYPTYIVSDVESVILADCGVRIDRRKIKVTQVSQSQGISDYRPVLKKVALSASKDKAEVVVEIFLDDVSVSGSAKGIPTPNQWLWLAAKATLDALDKMLSSKRKIVLNHVGIVHSKSTKVALVTLMLFENGQELILSGSCPIKYDGREAVVKATLDAVNRKFPTLLVN